MWGRLAYVHTRMRSPEANHPFLQHDCICKNLASLYAQQKKKTEDPKAQFSYSYWIAPLLRLFTSIGMVDRLKAVNDPGCEVGAKCSSSSSLCSKHFCSLTPMTLTFLIFVHLQSFSKWFHWLPSRLLCTECSSSCLNGQQGEKTYYRSCESVIVTWAQYKTNTHLNSQLALFQRFRKMYLNEWLILIASILVFILKSHSVGATT